jgi:hypothetical protein
MDPTAWKAGIGEQVRECLQSPVPGLPQPEPFFTYMFIAPPDFSDFKIFRQVLFVANLSDSTYANRRILQLLAPEEHTASFFVFAARPLCPRTDIGFSRR